MSLFLSNDAIRPLIDMPSVSAILEDALRARARGEVVNRPRLRVPIQGGAYNLMAAGWNARGVVGHKTYTANAKGASFHICLYASDGSGLLAVMEGLAISLLRTGAMSGIGAKYLAHRGRPIAVIGAGRQATAQVEGVLANLGGGEVRVFSRDAGKREDFAKRLRDGLGAQASPAASAEAALDGAGVVICITNSREPVLRAEWVSPGALVIGAGNNTWLNAEVGTDLVQRASRVVVDDVDQARIECGELMRAAETGAISWDRVESIHDVVAAGDVRPAEGDSVGLFEAQGIALADVAVAARVLELARERGLGQKLGG